MLDHILYKRMVRVQDQRLALSAKGTHIHAGHRVHLHHILHTACLLRQRNHGGNLLILKLLYLDRNLVILERLLHDVGNLLCLLVKLLLCFLGGLCLESVRHIRIDSLELDALILGLQLGDEGLIDIVGQDDRIHLCRLEHIDVLALLLFIRHIVNNLFLLLFLSAVFLFLRAVIHNLGLYLLTVLVNGTSGLGFFRINRLCLKALRQGQIFSVQILEQDVIVHLLTELVILQAAKLDERADVVPVFVVLFLLGLTHAGELVRHLLGNIFGNLLYKAVILQSASGYVQRQIRTVDHALEQKQELGNDFLDIICDEDLVVVQLDRSLDGFVLHVDLREVKDTL